MASRPRRLGVPTFYFDHSTLCHAFRGAVVHDAAHTDYAPLFPWIGRVSREANLCLSQAHLQELAQWGDTATADMMAEWLDKLDTVWLPEFSSVRDQEIEYWLRVAVEHAPDNPFLPFVPSMLSAVVVDPEALPGALEAATMPRMVGLFRQIDMTENVRKMQQLIAFGHADREAMAKAGISTQRMAETMAYREEVRLRQRAQEAHDRIVARGESLPLYTPQDVHVQDALVDLVSTNPKAMPSWRVSAAFSLAWINLVGHRTPGSKSSRALESSLGDYRHLTVGAAYCDVFTCDADVDRCLGNCRESLGLDRQLSTYHSNATNFVERLLATWP